MTTADLIAALAALPPDDMPKVIAAAAARWAQAQPAPLQEVNAADDESLTIEEAAALLRRSVKWMYRHRARLPFIKKIGPRSYLCSKGALLRWRDRQRA